MRIRSKHITPTQTYYESTCRDVLVQASTSPEHVFVHLVESGKVTATTVLMLGRISKIKPTAALQWKINGAVKNIKIHYEIDAIFT